jgi:hypothetical protein
MGFFKGHWKLILIGGIIISGMITTFVGIAVKATGKNQPIDFSSLKPSSQTSTIIPLSPTSAPSPVVTYTFSPSSVIRSSNPTVPILEWQIYRDATLGATFEYPTDWKLINARSDHSQTGVGSDYSIAFEDTTVPHHGVSIYISSISNPGNLSLADFYRKYFPSGAERYANIAFQEMINPHGVRLEKIVLPYVSPDYNETLEAVHSSRIYEITKTIAVPLSRMPVDANYHQDPKFQEAVAAYNHLINSFTFTN